MSTLPPILGHTRQLTHLRDALTHDRWHHAYLFEGPKGVGKHLVAVRLAMAANCEAPPDNRPCGACPTCRRILAGVHPDVVLIEPADDRASRTISVQQIREVIRASGYHRFDARQRIVIIDPAESMQPSAANALLKTLEEPPSGTGFILIATHASALLPTIRSRCQRVRFGPVDPEALALWLEARGIEEAGRLSRLAGGRPGRALTLADGALKTRLELRTKLLDALAGDLQGIFDFSGEICSGTRAAWVERVAEILEILEDLLRDALVRAVAPDRPVLNDDLLPLLDAWAKALWPGGLQTCQAAIQDTRADLVVNVTGKTTLDALFTRIATELGTARRAGR
jgi:DNA polymerase-3 subunit delta'